MTEWAHSRAESDPEETRAGGPALTDGGKPERGLFARHVDPAMTYAVADETTRVTDVNPSYRETFGVDRTAGGSLEERLLADLPESTTVEAETAADEVSDLSEAAAAGSRYRTLLGSQTGEITREYLARVVPADDDAGYLVLTDVTPQRTRIRELNDAVDRMDEFAGIVSHDLRNPLEVAKIQLEAAERNGEERHFRKAERALDRMEHLIDEVLTLAREGQVIDEVETIDFATAVRDAWTSVAAPEASLSIETNDVLRADGDRMQALLENLFRNAHEHGGRDVTVVAGTTDTGFHVTDDGPGIPEEERYQVLEAGYSTNEDGTGFGLNIVKRIAEAHGWTIEVTDGETGGAMFVFRT